MKYLLLIIAFPLFSASECRKHKKKDAMKEEITEAVIDTNAVIENPVVKDSLPPCVRKMIADSQKETPPNPPVQVDEYIYNGKLVFYVTAPCCDFYNTVYDDSCKTICAASGGFTGRGDGKCPGFSKEAKFIKTIWKQGSK